MYIRDTAVSAPPGTAVCEDACRQCRSATTETTTGRRALICGAGKRVSLLDRGKAATIVRNAK
jgi:hypothetical protein